MNRHGIWLGIGLLILGPGMGSCEPSKIRFDVESIDEEGLRGPQGGKVAVAYEFKIPDRPEVEARVKALDPSLQVYRDSRGRVNAGPGEVLCIGQTHQPGWREVLLALAELEAIAEIRECVFE